MLYLFPKNAPSDHTPLWNALSDGLTTHQKKNDWKTGKKSKSKKKKINFKCLNWWFF